MIALIVDVTTIFKLITTPHSYEGGNLNIFQLRRGTKKHWKMKRSGRGGSLSSTNVRDFRVSPSQTRGRDRYEVARLRN